MRQWIVLAGFALAAAKPSIATVPDAAAVEAAEARQAELDAGFDAILAEHRIVTAGAAIIQDGENVWSRYYGEQSPGVPASRDTLFNVASITKTVAAETLLRLAGAGLVSLDEPMVRYWTDPDIAGDSRSWLLTPRRVLTHSTGFPNWRFFLPSGELEFVRDPGTGFGYSGEGFEYLARFVEAKLGRDFEAVVEEQVFVPVGMEASAFGQYAENFPRMARPVDSDGVFHGYFCRPQSGWCREEGDSSAADDMTTTVEDYAAFLIAVMDHDGYDASLAAARNAIATVETDPSPVDCAMVEGDCPERMGFGLGWRVFDYGTAQVLYHGGSDWSEVASAYFVPQSRDGVIVFLNAPNANGIRAMGPVLELLDPGSVVAAHYRLRARR